MSRSYIGAAGAFLGAHAIGAGAFGSHYIRANLDEYQQHIWETAVKYELAHSAMIVTTSLVLRVKPDIVGAARLRNAATLWTAGATVFSGSLYALALGGPGMIFGPLTPVGGSALLLGWVACGLAFV